MGFGGDGIGKQNEFDPESKNEKVYTKTSQIFVKFNIKVNVKKN